MTTILNIEIKNGPVFLTGDRVVTKICLDENSSERDSKCAGVLLQYRCVATLAMSRIKKCTSRSAASSSHHHKAVEAALNQLVRELHSQARIHHKIRGAHDDATAELASSCSSPSASHSASSPAAAVVAADDDEEAPSEFSWTASTDYQFCVCSTRRVFIPRSAFLSGQQRVGDDATGKEAAGEEKERKEGGKSRAIHFEFQLGGGDAAQPSYQGHFVKIAHKICVSSLVKRQHDATDDVTAFTKVKQFYLPFRVLQSPYSSSSSPSSSSSLSRSNGALSSSNQFCKDFGEMKATDLKLLRNPFVCGEDGEKEEDEDEDDNDDKERSKNVREVEERTLTNTNARDATNFSAPAATSLSFLSNRNNKSVFNITSSGKRIATLSLFKNCYRLGDEIVGVFDFAQSSVACLNVSYSLVATESLGRIFQHGGRDDAGEDVGDDVTHQLFVGEVMTQHCLSAKCVPFSVPIPHSLSPQFSACNSAPLISLAWSLHIDFMIPLPDKSSSSSSSSSSNLSCKLVPPTHAHAHAHTHARTQREPLAWSLGDQVNVDLLSWNLPVRIMAANPSAFPLQHLAAAFKHSTLVLS